MTMPRVEVITSVERRRRWSREEKERLVAASFEPEVSASEVARSAGIHVSQLFRWRKDLCDQVDAGSSQLVPVEIVPAAAMPPVVESGLNGVLCTGEDTALRDAVLVAKAAGAGAVAIPVVEALMARWVAQEAGWEEDDGVGVGATSRDGWTALPWGRWADHVYAIEGESVVAHAGPLTVLRESANLAREPRDMVAVPDPAPRRAATSLTAGTVLARLALLKAAAMAGALNGALRICVEHAAQREQFGRPIAQFQAVQQMLALLAAQAAAVETAVDLLPHDGPLRGQPSGRRTGQILVDVLLKHWRLRRANMRRSDCCRKHDLSPPFSLTTAANIQLIILSFLNPIERPVQPMDAPVAINLVGPLKCFAGQNQSVWYRPLLAVHSPRHATRLRLDFVLLVRIGAVAR